MAITGSGTLANPYVLREPADLDFIRTRLTSHYRLANDIDMSPYGEFTPIGNGITSAQRFTGTFNGNGNKIINLKIRTTVQYSGLFTSIGANGIIENLAVVDADIQSTQSRTGLIAGVVLSDGFILNCYSSGNVISQLAYAGGLVGFNDGIIENCFSFSNVYAPSHAYGISAAGSLLAIRINNCYFYGMISSEPTSTENGAITRSTLSTGNRVNDCYYDSKVVNINNSIGTPLSTAEMKSGIPFPNWNTNTWTFEEGKYPYLTILGEPIYTTPAQKQTIQIDSYMDTLTSSLERHRRKVITSLTFTQDMSQSLTKEAQRATLSMIEDIVSNIEILENAKVKTHIVESYINGIGTEANRYVRATKVVDSGIQPFGIIIDIFVPIEIEKPVYASVWIMENQSTIETITNKTNIYRKENRTEMSVI